VLFKLSLNQRAATSLIARSNLFSWLEIQVQQKGSAISDDSIIETWFRIIENLLVSMDTDRIEARTGGVWRGHCIRCLEGLLRLLRIDTPERSAAVSINCLASTSRIILRIAEQPYLTLSLTRALRACVDTLQHVEKTFSLENSTDTVERLWAELQVRIWWVMMRMKISDRSLDGHFDILTARVVALDRFAHSKLDVEISRATEWARTQTLLMYSSDSRF
jgi:hypothetical protein